MAIGGFQLGVVLIILLFELVMIGFALIDAALRPTTAFTAADKQNKMFWLIILGLALAAALVMGALSFITLIGLVAAIVYLVDARPALRGVGKRGGSNNGPYGPY